MGNTGYKVGLEGLAILCRLFRNQEELEKLSELGVLFLLFEMGLELSLDRLKVKPNSSSQQVYEDLRCFAKA